MLAWFSAAVACKEPLALICLHRKHVKRQQLFSPAQIHVESTKTFTVWVFQDGWAKYQCWPPSDETIHHCPPSLCSYWVIIALSDIAPTLCFSSFPLCVGVLAADSGRLGGSRRPSVHFRDALRLGVHRQLPLRPRGKFLQLRRQDQWVHSLFPLPCFVSFFLHILFIHPSSRPAPSFCFLFFVAWSHRIQ